MKRGRGGRGRGRGRGGRGGRGGRRGGHSARRAERKEITEMLDVDDDNVGAEVVSSDESELSDAPARPEEDSSSESERMDDSGDESDAESKKKAEKKKKNNKKKKTGDSSKQRRKRPLTATQMAEKSARDVSNFPSEVFTLTPKSFHIGDRAMGTIAEVNDTNGTLSVHLCEGIRVQCRVRKPARTADGAESSGSEAEGLSALVVGDKSGDPREEEPGAALSTPLSELWAVGQPVCCRVVKFRAPDAARAAAVGTSATQPTVMVSMKPSRVNKGTDARVLTRGSTLWCAVKSVEDHGCVMETGVPGIKAAFLKGDHNLKPGMALLCSVVSFKASSGVLNLDVCGGASARKPRTLDERLPELTREAVRPGMLVRATVRHFVKGVGCAATLDDLLMTTMPFTRMVVEDKPDEGKTTRRRVTKTRKTKLTKAGDKDADSDSEMDDEMEEAGGVVEEGEDDIVTECYGICLNETVDARVVYISHDGKNISVSALPHTVAAARDDKPEFPKDAAYGDLLTDCTVLRVLPGLGAVLTHGTSGDDDFAHIFVHARLIPRIPENEPSKLVGRIDVQCRVVGHDVCGRYVLASLKPEDISQRPLRPQDLVPGALYTAWIRSVRNDGRRIMVTLNEAGTKAEQGAVVAVCDALHYADTPVAEPLITFRAGQKFRCRVLDVDVARGRVFVTHRQSLVDSKYAPLTSFQAALPGTIANGFVVRVTDSAILVAFFGPVRALVKKADTGCPADVPLASKFAVGQPVVVSITSASPDNNKLWGTLNIDTDATGPVDQRLASVNWDSFAPGCTVQATVKALKPYGLSLEFPNALGVTGFVPKNHAGGDMGRFKAGDEVRAFVLDVNKRKGIIDCSLSNNLVGSEPSHKIPKPVKGDNKTEVIVQLVTRNRVIVTVPAMNNAVAIQTTTSHSTDAAAVAAADELFKTYHPAQHWNAVLTYVSSVLQATLVSRTAEFESAVTSISDVVPGMLVRAKVLSKTPSWLNVALGTRVRGRVHLSEVWDWERLGTGHPFDGIVAGQEVEACVLGTRDRDVSASASLSAAGDATSTVRVAELTLRPSMVHGNTGKTKTKFTRPDAMTDLKVGQIVVGYVQQVTPDGLWFHVTENVRGHLHILDASDDVPALRNFQTSYKQGQSVRLVVTSIDATRGQLDASVKLCADVSVDVTHMDVPEPFAVGSIVPGRVIKLVQGRGVLVQLGPHVYGHVGVTEFDDRFRADPLEGIHVNDIMNFSVIENKEDEARSTESEKPARSIELSLRKSKIGKVLHKQNNRAPITVNAATGKKTPKDKVKTLSGIKKDDIVYGYVRGTSKDGASVQLGSGVGGFVPRAMLADRIVNREEAVKKYFPIGRLLRMRVLNVDEERKGVLLACKESVVDAEKWLNFEKLEVGMKVTGRVQNTAKYGVFVNIDNSRMHGLCVFKNMNTGGVEVPKEKLLAVFAKDMPVTATIAKLDAEKKKIDLAMNVDPSTIDMAIEANAEKAASVAVKVDKDEKEAAEAEIVAKKPRKEEVAPLQVESEFDWGSVTPKEDKTSKMTDDNDDDDDDDNDEERNEEKSEDDDDEDDDDVLDDDDDEEDDDDDDEMNDDDEKGEVGVEIDDDDDDSDEEKAKEAEKKDQTRGQKKAAKREREREIQRMEDDLARGKAPESAAEFERFVANNPSSSYAWIKYMAFQLSQNNIDGARAIAERGIAKLATFVRGGSGEDELLNAHIALLNLENNFGTAKTFKAALDRALQANDDCAVLEQTAKLLEESGKTKEADEMFKRLLKKRKTSVKTWGKYAVFCIRSNPKFDARAFFERAKQSVPPAKYTRLITLLARIEFKHGSPERGRTMFAGLLGLHPKRVDIWDVYLDQELRLGDIDKCRSLFEQTVALKVSSKKIQHFFKRWLLFEKQFGTNETVANVKKKAQQYVDSKTA